jgi:predicted lipid-binding transport protein (Tim44 family)
LEFVVRRLLSIATLALLLSAVLLTFALPGFATESEESMDQTEMSEEAEHAEDAEPMSEDAEHAEASAELDEVGQWTGLQGAIVAGVLLGALAFVMSGVSGLGGEDH